MQNLRARGNQRPANRRVIWLAATTVFLQASGLTFAGLPAEDSENWSLRKETDRIRVYTTDQPNSSFQAFKAVAVLDVPIENLMAVMINPKSCVQWVHNCSESYAFGSGDFDERYAYSVAR